MDQMLIRCPRLGDEVTFGYCRKEGGDLPCPRTLVCWQPCFPVEGYLRQNLSPEQWRRCFDSPAKSKIVSLVELIEEAKNRLREET